MEMQECEEESPGTPDGDNKRSGDSKESSGVTTAGMARAMDALRDLNEVLLKRHTSLAGCNVKELHKDLELIVAYWQNMARRSDR